MLCLSSLGHVSCRSIYRETQQAYPADPCARLRLRIQEAQRAEVRAEEAAVKLRDRLREGLDDRAIQPDADRLEMTTLDFKRRVLSARDVAADCGNHGQFESDLNALERRAAKLQDVVAEVRRKGAGTSLSHINSLLNQPAQP